MTMCKHLRLRSHKNVKYLFCVKRKRSILKSECNDCQHREFRKIKKMKNRSGKRAKACDIPTRVKALVWQRDGGKCIICGNNGLPNSHYIKRSKGGLGIEQNIVCMCISCHNSYDNGKDKTLVNSIKEKTKDYLKKYYGDNWNEENLIYRKENF